MNALAARSPLLPRRKGWCPGALKPMETGDGLLARVRAPRARLSLDQAAALADAALACANGAIGLSARANLHLRGVSERMLPELHARLQQAGLIDADPEIERLRNVVSSPIDDLDPDSAFDLAEGVYALEARLSEDERLRRLPAKFSFVLDAKGRLPLGDIDADIRFEALRIKRSRCLSAAKTRSPRNAHRARPAKWRRASASRSWRSPARAKRRRGGCARSSSTEGRRRYSPRHACKRGRAGARKGAPRCATSWARRSSARASWSARRRSSASSRRAGSRP